MAKSKIIRTLSASINQDLELSLKGSVNKNFKLNNNRKKVYIYTTDTLEKLFEINVKPAKGEENVYSIDLVEVKEGVIESVNEMNNKFGDIFIIGLYNSIGDIKTSTIVLKEEE